MSNQAFGKSRAGVAYQPEEGWTIGSPGVQSNKQLRMKKKGTGDSYAFHPGESSIIKWSKIRFQFPLFRDVVEKLPVALFYGRGGKWDREYTERDCSGLTFIFSTAKAKDIRALILSWELELGSFHSNQYWEQSVSYDFLCKKSHCIDIIDTLLSSIILWLHIQQSFMIYVLSWCSNCTYT